MSNVRMGMFLGLALWIPIVVANNEELTKCIHEKGILLLCADKLTNDRTRLYVESIKKKKDKNSGKSFIESMGGFWVRS